MNVLILGNGDEELDWARWLLGRAEHRLDAAFPGFGEPSMAGIPAPRDLEDALARVGLDVVIVGGPVEFRGEALRRAAAEGFAIICLHPPGTDSEPYYQVALSREETGATIVPDLPLRLHPGVAALHRALSSGELGVFRAIRWEVPVDPPGTDLVRVAFPRAVDVVRALLGEIEALTATGDPPGEDPDFELVVQLRAFESRRAEVRLRSGAIEPARLILLAANGSLTLEMDSGLRGPMRLIRHTPPEPSQVIEIPPWDAHEAILSVVSSSMGRPGGPDLPSPSLLDGTRAMELSEAAARSLRRGRTVDLHYEAISEEATFKSVMTSTGCLILLALLFILPFSMAGPSLGLKWTLFIPYLIPPVLVLFVVMQFLRLAVRRRGSLGDGNRAEAKKSRAKVQESGDDLG
ncbi:MAG: hypothetical protein ACLQGP_08890 [Isosphaeraceae bacterium]